MNTEDNLLGQTYQALRDAVSSYTQFTAVVNWNKLTHKFELDSLTADAKLQETAWPLISAEVNAMIQRLNTDAARIGEEL